MLVVVVAVRAMLSCFRSTSGPNNKRPNEFLKKNPSFFMSYQYSMQYPLFFFFLCSYQLCSMLHLLHLFVIYIYTLTYTLLYISGVGRNTKSRAQHVLRFNTKWRLTSNLAWRRRSVDRSVLSFHWPKILMLVR